MFWHKTDVGGMAIWIPYIIFNDFQIRFHYNVEGLFLDNVEIEYTYWPVYELIVTRFLDITYGWEILEWIDQGEPD